MEKQLVVFYLAGEYYGVDIAMVDSIIEMQAITVVPRAPAFIEGITNLRGTILPVINLSKRLGLNEFEQTTGTRIIVVEENHIKAGMIVDAVTEVLRITEATIEPLSPIVITANSVFITGVIRVGERLVILLDLRQILTPEEKGSIKELQSAEDNALLNPEA